MKSLPRPVDGGCLSDERVRKLMQQALFLAAIMAVLAVAAGNVVRALAERGMEPSFGFLRLSSGITVGETLIAFDSSSSNLRALAVGLLNTLSVAILVIACSSAFGLFVALCRISSNWLVSRIAKAYIEVIRNIPLLMLLLIWYRAFFLRLPGIKNSLMLGKAVAEDGAVSARLILSNRGLYLACPVPTEHFGPYKAVLLAAAVVAAIVYAALAFRSRRSGRAAAKGAWAALCFLAVALGGLVLMAGRSPLRMDVPRLGRFNASGGLHLSSEWFSLFSGLVLYTSAYVAEAFRAGIQGVPKGQLEAARALGLGRLRAIRLVVLPQARIVAIPPLTSIFLGVAKNTSLGVAIGFPDLFSITGTVINQTGRALEMILIAMAIYLALSLATSAVMNVYNERARLVER